MNGWMAGWLDGWMVTLAIGPTEHGESGVYEYVYEYVSSADPGLEV
jgi:hypothetical protein